MGIFKKMALDTQKYKCIEIISIVEITKYLRLIVS